MKRLATISAIGLALALNAPGALAMSHEDKSKEHTKKQDKPHHAQQMREQGEDQRKAQHGFKSVVGTVVSIQDMDLKAPNQEGSVSHRLVKLETPDGKNVVIDLGESAKLKEAEAADQIKEGNRIYAIGKSARIGGKPVIFARYAGQLTPVGSTGMAQR